MHICDKPACTVVVGTVLHRYRDIYVVIHSSMTK